MKYPFKGPSFAYVECRQADDGQGRVNVDEPKQYAKMYYRSAMEAYSRIMSYRYAFLSHHVMALTFHLPGKQKVYYAPNKSMEMARRVEAGELPETTLTQYWKQCKEDSKIAALLYEQMPQFYIWNRSLKRWVDPKKNRTRPAIGRIMMPSPKQNEAYAAALLTKHYPGNYEDLLNVNGHICGTFIEAAKLRGLLEDDQVWMRTLQEASVSGFSARYQTNHLKHDISVFYREMRQLYANILVFGGTHDCFVPALQLWEEFAHFMYDHRPGMSELEHKRRKERALALIERLLANNGKQCRDFGLPQPVNSITNDIERSLDEFFFPQLGNLARDDEPDETVDTSAFENARLTDDQRNAYKLIHDALLSDKNDARVDRLFFVSGDGGTGKTFLYNFTIHNTRRMGKKVLTTASTGMAGTLLFGGMTAHSAFRLGINVIPGKCNKHKNFLLTYSLTFQENCHPFHWKVSLLDASQKLT